MNATAVNKANVTTKRDYKQLAIAGVNLALAGISVYLFDFWFGLIGQLDGLTMSLNIGVIILAVSTLFVGKTFYGKGTVNNIKKILYTVGLAILTVALMLFISLDGDIMYPLSGLVLVMIAFYMLAVSANTLNLIGMVAIAMVLGGGIAYSVMKSHIEWGTAGHLAEATVFLILFLGGVWPHLRRFAHGVTGVNKDGGGFGSSDSEGGDADDGDGDTGDE